MQRKTENAAQSAAESVESVNKSVENGAQSVQERAQSEKNGVKSGAQNENTTGQTVSGTENGAQSVKEKYSLSEQEVSEIKKGVRVITDTENNTIIEIQTDVLADVPKSDWAARIKNVIRSVFPKGFSLNGEHIDVSSKSRGEFTNSGDSVRLRNNNPEIYADKMRAAPHLDVISQNTEYKNRLPKHERTDNITSFDEGKVRLKIGDNEYDANVLIGVRDDGSKLFYDISDMDAQKKRPPIGSQSAQTANTEGRRSSDNISSDGSISDSSKNVNTQNEYSAEYQKGAEHPNTVGGMESKPGSYYAEMNRTGAQPDKSITKHRYSDYDAYLDDPNVVVYSADKKALERKVYNEYKGERTVWQETVDGVIDGDTYFTEDGKYYVKTAEGKTRRVAQGAYRFAGFLRCDDI